MLSPEQLSAYLEDTLSIDERPEVEALLASDPEAQRELVEQQRVDQALRALLGNARAHEKVRQSILAVVRATPVNNSRPKSSKPPFPVRIPTTCRSGSGRPEEFEDWSTLRFSQSNSVGSNSLWTATDRSGIGRWRIGRRHYFPAHGSRRRLAENHRHDQIEQHSHTHLA